MSEYDTAAWYALGIPLVGLLFAIEIFLAWRRRQPVFSFAETVSNLTAGLGTLVIGLFVGPSVLAAWGFVHDHVAPWPWPAHGAWKLAAALVLADFCYYVYHRAGHRFALFWAIHGIHHQHEKLNSTVGLRLEWLADPYAALFFGLMPLAGVDATTGFAAIALLSLYTLTAHSPVVPRPTWGFLITPAIHGSHHSRDARFAHKNYGAMLGVWDRLFGTWLEPAPGTELVADVPTVCRTHDGVAAQFGLFAELGHQVGEALRRTRSPREALRLLVGRPVLPARWAPLRPDAEIDGPTRVYVVAHFLALVALAAWLLWFRAERPLPLRLVAAATIVAGLSSLGGILDGRPGAFVRERWRLGATVGAALLFALALGAPAAGAALGLVALAGLLFEEPALPSTG
jgi:sterol desaturase/sphingolipid hydroxylase (fatty acid hydroxylase superfamily)